MKLRFYSLYPEDFECDEKVRRLDLEGIGFFLLCLNYAWTNDGLPPDFGPKFGGLLPKDPRKFARLWLEVSPNFPLAADGRFRNPRQEDERKKSLSAYRAKVKGGKARWNREQEHEQSLSRPQEHNRTYLRIGNGLSSYESISTDHGFLSGDDDRAREKPPPPPPPPNGIVPLETYPLTARAIRECYPATDARFLGELVATTSAAAADIPQPSALEFSDELLADAVRRCRNDSPAQRSVKLFLTTVPRCISSWMQYGRELPPRKPTKTELMLDEVCEQAKTQRLAKEAQQTAKGAHR